MRLLDPRFHYVPAAATDVATTFKRFGFNPRANAERRARVRRLVALVTEPGHSETAVIQPAPKLQS